MKTVLIKSLFIVGCLVLIAASSEEYSKITVKKQERPEKELSLQKTFRGTNCVLIEMKDRNVRTRTYIINGKTVAIEGDEDGNGSFETLMIFDSDTRDFDEFIKAPDGTVKPLDSAKFEALKLKRKTADNALSDFMRTNSNANGQP